MTFDVSDVGSDTELEMRPPQSEQPRLYEYAPLDTTKSQIRLLTLRPSTLDQAGRALPVSCELEAFDVDDLPQYITLSYVWGPPQPTYAILLNGRCFEVRENLFNFLEMFRDNQHNTHHIWIDQLCIDQQSSIERNHQVSMMAQIYRRCQFVMAWLGNPPGSESDPITWTEENTLSESSVRMILENQYFTRVWIIQEILLPPEIVLVHGRNWIAWPQFDLPALKQLKAVGAATTYFLIGARRMKTVGSWTVNSLGYALFTFNKHQCQDARDRVYGLLSLATSDEHVPEVDYRKSEFEVFVDAVTSISRNVVFRRHLTGIFALALAMKLNVLQRPKGWFTDTSNPDKILHHEECHLTPSIAEGSLKLEVKTGDEVYEAVFSNAETAVSAYSLYARMTA
ncbi:hypothetical protein SLS60_004425 [Paraconiothyrium brasiliense]|uniref:Heterokaryon incompatibility domain-containing protein n=1 Tax=Paraconiothyrium brasiliense TaxID=300254 RepID=A0ABR3RKB6_9PLEO